ncbi:uncharacterized protein LOC131149190 [Malania oleifera]|uniref:uncharacterized protein LOC131149190 n=1 Tax=Malania oleifera TaxID=397392 RepID=UPI0025AE2CC5|nr:uncharacterized protein LOC131149190 [Malania oleifera]
MGSTSTAPSKKWHPFSWLHGLSLFFLFTVSFSTLMVSSSSSPQISYSDHCGSVVPESTPTELDDSTFVLPQLQNGFYNGGDRILNKSSVNSAPFSKSLWFQTPSVYKTKVEGVFKIEGSVTLQSQEQSVGYWGRYYYQAPRGSGSGSLSFSLHGFWSESSGKLCMVGSAKAYSEDARKLLDFAAVLKLIVPKISNISTTMVTGTLESLSLADELNYFDPISILMFHQTNYNYTLVSEEFDKGCSGGTDNVPQSASLGLRPGRSLCSMVSGASEYKLEYARDCNSTKNCSPFGGDINSSPNIMSLTSTQCSDEKKMLQFLVEFSTQDYFWYNQPFNPNTTLVGEGSWDSRKNRLCIVACRILNVTDSSAKAHVGDCSFRLTLSFPAIWSLTESSKIVGQIWTNKSAKDLGYFNGITYRNVDNGRQALPGLKYNYTETDRVKKSCPAKKQPSESRKERYPNEDSYDMRFRMSIKNSQGTIAQGDSYPLSVGDHIYDGTYAMSSSDSWSGSSNDPAVTAIENHSSPTNISYKMSLTLTHDAKLGDQFSLFNLSSSSSHWAEISAEGTYDAETGKLCMVGCRHLVSNIQFSTKYSMDCELLVNVQFPPLNAKKRGLIKGTIVSNRKKADPLFFYKLDFVAATYYMVEAEQSIWRMDFETVMVLLSETLACVFIVLQIFYGKRHPEVLPSISLIMLVILTLGHMIPLLLNFEALFLGTHNPRHIWFRTGGWLEMNEVIVRVVMMIAFLMQIRLLQLSLSAKLANRNDQKDSWGEEKKALYVTLPLYVAGGLIAFFVHWRKNKYDPIAHFSRHHIRQQQLSVLHDLRSFAGLVSDGFLFPQILLNMFGNSKGKYLSHSFYIGTTLIRMLPHAYDLYRAHTFTRDFDEYMDTYIYANPGADLYSTAWDVIIACGCLLFAVIIYLQQRFGGRCILPQRFRVSEEYEKVPTMSSVE